jgi:hypothetical protein
MRAKTPADDARQNMADKMGVKAKDMDDAVDSFLSAAKKKSDAKKPDAPKRTPSSRYKSDPRMLPNGGY